MTFNEGGNPTFRDLDPQAVGKLDHDAELRAIDRHLDGMPNWTAGELAAVVIGAVRGGGV